MNIVFRESFQYGVTSSFNTSFYFSCRNSRMSEEQAKKNFERAMRLEHEFKHYFTGLTQIFKYLLFFTQSFINMHYYPIQNPIIVL